MSAHAVGWATVELDRAALELMAMLEVGTTFEPASGSQALGARCRVGRARQGMGEAPLVVLLEPSTEGRLAGLLARRGEGWCARWDLAPTLDVSGWRPGPLGPEQLRSESAADGSFRLLVRPATIDG
jgi:hypothetical protein